MSHSGYAPHAPIDLLTNALYVGATLLLAYALLAWLVARPVFALHHMEVHGDLAHVSEAQIQLVSSRSLRGNFFTVDLDKVRSEFEKLPWIREARITRRWPDRLVMELHEHEPLGVWSKSQLVSSTGEVFNATSDQPLPALNGLENAGPEVVEAYQKFSATLAPLGMKVSELSLSSRRAWRIKTTNAQTNAQTVAVAETAPAPQDIEIALGRQGIEIALGRKDAQTRLARFASQYNKVVGQLGAAPVYVDLRYADGFALKRAAPTPAVVAHLNGQSE